MPMWLAIHAIRNMDCTNDESEDDDVTFERTTSKNELEVLCKIPYPASLGSVRSTVNVCLSDLFRNKIYLDDKSSHVASYFIESKRCLCQEVDQFFFN